MKRNIEIRSKKQVASSKKRVFNSWSIVNCPLSILAMILFTLSASAQVISLDSVLSAIDKQNPMLQEYDSKVRAMNAERDKGMFVINLEQDIPNPGKLNARRNYFASKAAVEEKGRSYQYNQLRSEAKENYYQWLVLEKKQKVLLENKRIVELMLKLARIRYPYNQGSLGNIYKAEARLHEVDNMILMNSAEMEDKAYRLKSLMKISGEVPMQVDTTTVINFDANKVLYDTAGLSANRSDVQQINRSIEVMKQNQLWQKSQSKPDFRIRYEHMQPVGDMVTQFSLMAMVSIPIVPWASRMYKSEVAGMSHEIEAMKKGREAILTDARGMIAGMASQLVRMKQQLENYDKKIIPALKKNYETLLIAYEENREQLPIVIDGWESMNMAQMEYLNKMEAYYLMIVRYEKEIEK